MTLDHPREIIQEASYRGQGELLTRCVSFRRRSTATSSIFRRTGSGNELATTLNSSRSIFVRATTAASARRPTPGKSAGEIGGLFWRTETVDATFDKFGLSTFRRGGKYLEVYFDDLSYTARRDKNSKFEFFYADKVSHIAYPPWSAI
jgi:hypothetical protein